MITCKNKVGFESAKKAVEQLNFKVNIDNEKQTITADNKIKEQQIIKLAKTFIEISKNDNLCICPRCNGSGNYSYNFRWGTTCFKCKGAGFIHKEER